MNVPIPSARIFLHREITVKKEAVFVSVASIMIGGAVSCSSDTAPAARAPGTLPPGTAQLTVGDKATATTDAVQCTTNYSLTMITTGDDTSGATVMLSNAEQFGIESVSIRNFEGFTGSYHQGLQGDATVALTGPTYQFAGTARGFSPDSVQPQTLPFTIKVTC